MNRTQPHVTGAIGPVAAGIPTPPDTAPPMDTPAAAGGQSAATAVASLPCRGGGTGRVDLHLSINGEIEVVATDTPVYVDADELLAAVAIAHRQTVQSIPGRARLFDLDAAGADTRERVARALEDPTAVETAANR